MCGLAIMLTLNILCVHLQSQPLVTMQGCYKTVKDRGCPLIYDVRSLTCHKSTSLLIEQKRHIPYVCETRLQKTPKSTSVNVQ